MSLVSDERVEQLLEKEKLLEAEVERLRAALCQSLGFLDTAMLTVNEEVRRKTREVVRAALGGKNE